ncbi:MAG TPA: sensor histidine kinase [Chitinophagaceae bacterium]
MPDKFQEVYVVIVIGITLALLLVGFILTILFLYQRRQHRQEQELTKMKDLYDRELLQSQLEIKEATLKTIAQELHDNIGQMLTVVKFSLAGIRLVPHDPNFETIQESKQMLNKAIYDLSDLTKSMHTDRIAQIGLVEAIRFEMEMLAKMKLFETSFTLSQGTYHFDAQKEIFLFRIFQEILNNTIKHSKASRVDVSVLCSEDDRFSFIVKDDGLGFDVQEKQHSGSRVAGVGLKSMVNRAKLIGAVVNIESEPGKGTSVEVQLPLQKEQLLHEWH